MCLVTPQKESSKTTKDIICYKVLTKKMESPFMCFKFELNKLYTDSINAYPEEFWNHLLIGEGYFHSILDYEIALDYILYLEKKNNVSLDLYKAMIPKDSEIYYGYREQCCSKSLKIIEKCDRS